MDKILAPIKARILQFIEKQGIVREIFFEKIGIASSNFRGKGMLSEIGGDKIVKILTDFKELNPAWLVLGEGRMLRDYLQFGSNNTISENEISYGNTKIDDLKAALEDKNKLIKAQERLIRLMEMELDNIKSSKSSYSKHTSKL